MRLKTVNQRDWAHRVEECHLKYYFTPPSFTDHVTDNKQRDEHLSKRGDQAQRRHRNLYNSSQMGFNDTLEQFEVQS